DPRTNTVRVFNIHNPAKPVKVRDIVTTTGAVHEVTALNGRLYTAGIFSDPRSEIYDISNVGDITKPVPLLSIIFPGDYVHTAWPTDGAQFVAIAREKQGGDLSFWNVSDLANPNLAWSIQLPITEAYCVHQVIIQGDRLYASWYQAGIRVYDISDRYNP